MEVEGQLSVFSGNGFLCHRGRERIHGYQIIFSNFVFHWGELHYETKTKGQRGVSDC